mmetsp:Transcript_29340/g.87769  ORF Transcript_29340/g.87769 Transcript_29340/m.87769 type:complete len:108 (+) Transcript_29340:702-1025(+)
METSAKSRMRMALDDKMAHSSAQNHWQHPMVLLRGVLAPGAQAVAARGTKSFLERSSLLGLQGLAHGRFRSNRLSGAPPRPALSRGMYRECTGAATGRETGRKNGRH